MLSDHDLFLDHFKPMMFNTNVRQNDDNDLKTLCNNVRIGNINVEVETLLKSRLCGEGHPKGDSCLIINSSAVLCSLHRERREISHEFNSSSDDQTAFQQICSIDTDQVDAPAPKYIVEKINRLNNALENILNVRIGTPLILTKNINLEQGIY